ncbi:MAG: hypothetical protein Kow00108_18660 [Calditrichia bacterium]
MSYHVLIVSSNIILSKRIDIILTMEGFTCLPILKGSEVLNLIMKHKFDAVLIDEKIEDEPVPEIIEMIRRVNKVTPIFVVTKSNDNDEFKIMEELGPSYFMNKSLISEVLPEKLKAMIEK